MTTVSVEILKSTSEEFQKLFATKTAISNNGFITSKYSSKLNDSLEYSCLNGGKRLRPILSLYTAEAILKNSNINLSENPALGIAYAIEMVHCGSLVHDDLPCMDDDKIRRGKPTTHIQFDEATALLAGDMLLVKPIQQLIETNIALNLNSELNLKLVHELTIAIQKMIIGQAMDLELENRPSSENTDIQESQIMQKYKTGALLNMSVRGGAIAAGADTQTIQQLGIFANNLGLAFQITDDILDVTSDVETMGKQTQKDSNKNKFTYVEHYGLDKTKKLAEELIIESNEILSKLDIYSDKLKFISNYVIQRNH